MSIARITSTSPHSTTRVASSIVILITSRRVSPLRPTIRMRTVSMIAMTQSWATLARTGRKEAPSATTKVKMIVNSL